MLKSMPSTVTLVTGSSNNPKKALLAGFTATIKIKNIAKTKPNFNLELFSIVSPQKKSLKNSS